MTERLQEGLEKERLETERRKIFDRVAFWGIVSIVGTTLTCANPVFVAAVIPSYGLFVRYFAKYEQLEKETN